MQFLQRIFAILIGSLILVSATGVHVHAHQCLISGEVNLQLNHSADEACSLHHASHCSENGCTAVKSGSCCKLIDFYAQQDYLQSGQLEETDVLLVQEPVFYPLDLFFFQFVQPGDSLVKPDSCREDGLTASSADPQSDLQVYRC